LEQTAGHVIESEFLDASEGIREDKITRVNEASKLQDDMTGIENDGNKNTADLVGSKTIEIGDCEKMSCSTSEMPIKVSGSASASQQDRNIQLGENPSAFVGQENVNLIHENKNGTF
jgi:hypothetical protein